MNMEPQDDTYNREDNVLPTRPTTLPELAETVLEALSREPLSENIVLGGGVALKHYDDFRATQDIDAWWRGFRDPATLERLLVVVRHAASKHGYQIEHRHFGVTDSLEFMTVEARRKIFSFQISIRDVPLEEPRLSAWPPIRIETFRDNIGSKMNALVNRGAPRDLVDIYRVVNDGLIATAACWVLWQQKNPDTSVEEARGKVLTHLTRLELRRPLASLSSSEEQNAFQLRQWYRDAFLVSQKEI